MKHIFVIDSNSFLDQPWEMDNIFKEIEEYFGAQNNPDYFIVISKYRRDAIVLIQKQMDKTKDMDIVRVYAIGGDEIMFDCLNGIAGLPDIELAIMPSQEGICNFLRNFGPEKAALFQNIKSLIQAPVIPTDIINLGRLYGINACIIGFASAVPFKNEELANKIGSDISKLFIFKRMISNLSNLFTALNKRIIAQYYNIMIDDRDYSGNYALINVANGPYYNNARITVKEAAPDDGLLDIALFKSAGFFRNMRIMKKYSRGKTLSNYSIHLRAKKITIKSDELIWIQLDGEFFQDNQLAIEVVPGAMPIAAVNNLTYANSGSRKKGISNEK